MAINIPTGQDILRDTAIQYVNKAFVYITDCNPPLNAFSFCIIGNWPPHTYYQRGHDPLGSPLPTPLIHDLENQFLFFGILLSNVHKKWHQLRQWSQAILSFDLIAFIQAGQVQVHLFLFLINFKISIQAEKVKYLSILLISTFSLSLIMSGNCLHLEKRFNCAIPCSKITLRRCRLKVRRTCRKRRNSWLKQHVDTTFPRHC